MIERRRRPSRGGVAFLTGLRNSQCHVVRRVRLHVRRLVARVAAGIQPLKLARRRALVTVRAIQAGVASDQGEAVFVIVGELQGYVPTLRRVTLFAGAHLAAMDVGVAVAATGPGVRKYGLGVALRAGHSRVHPSQRKVGLVVIELGDCSDRLPAHRGMTVLAGNVQVSMRTAGYGLGVRLGEAEISRGAKPRD